MLFVLVLVAIFMSVVYHREEENEKKKIDINEKRQCGSVILLPRPLGQDWAKKIQKNFLRGGWKIVASCSPCQLSLPEYGNALGARHAHIRSPRAFMRWTCARHQIRRIFFWKKSFSHAHAQIHFVRGGRDRHSLRHGHVKNRFNLADMWHTHHTDTPKRRQTHHLSRHPPVSS